jgi:hypothetical protein
MTVDKDIRQYRIVNLLILTYEKRRAPNSNAKGAVYVVQLDYNFVRIA